MCLESFNPQNTIWPEALYDQIPPDLMIANEPSNYLPLHTLCVEGVLISLQTFNATPYPIRYQQKGGTANCQMRPISPQEGSK